MSEVTHFFDTICAKVQEKNQLGFGISSPHAKVLDAAVKGFEVAVVKTGVIPSEWDHKSSIGKGNLASVVWVVFLPPGQTAQDGIYISCCFGKSGNGLVAGCAISNTSKAKYHYVVADKIENNEVKIIDPLQDFGCQNPKFVFIALFKPTSS